VKKFDVPRSMKILYPSRNHTHAIAMRAFWFSLLATVSTYVFPSLILKQASSQSLREMQWLLGVEEFISLSRLTHGRWDERFRLPKDTCGESVID
jgi:hypothetical protein